MPERLVVDRQPVQRPTILAAQVDVDKVAGLALQRVRVVALRQVVVVVVLRVNGVLVPIHIAGDGVFFRVFPVLLDPLLDRQHRGWLNVHAPVLRALLFHLLMPPRVFTRHVGVEDRPGTGRPAVLHRGVSVHPHQYAVYNLGMQLACFVSPDSCGFKTQRLSHIIWGVERNQHPLGLHHRAVVQAQPVEVRLIGDLVLAVHAWREPVVDRLLRGGPELVCRIAND